MSTYLRGHNVSELCRRLIPGLLALVALLGAAASSEADVVLRKRVIRHVPSDLWCPNRGQYDLWFIATTSSATLSITASPEDFEGESILVDDIKVVEESVFESGFRADLPVDPDDPDDSAAQCWNTDGGAPYFHDDFGSFGVPFAEEFGDPAGWTLVNAEIADGILLLGVDTDSGAEAKVTLTDLEPGTRYFVTGWSSWSNDHSDDAGFAVSVDTPRPPAFFLQDGRFRLELRYEGSRLAGGEVVSDRSAQFWFRDPLKTELIVNVVDRCEDQGTYFVMAGGTVAVQATITIIDQETGRRVVYRNRAGARFQTKIDQTTFQCD